ncbi:13340_t:CDS:2, partial [Acaulospora colombiana]
MAFRNQYTGNGGSQRLGGIRTLELGGSAMHQRPRAPISPPETEKSAQTLFTMDRTTALDPRQHTLDYQEPEEPGFKYPPRRGSSIHYNQNTGIGRQPPRTTRWLLVVLPPSSLSNEPSMGPTLAMGAPGRFNNGILMPLFPTMYAQLTAIAREFSLPSTSGVCLYLRPSEPQFNISPRISDEAWPLLWGAHFGQDDGNMQGASRLPICGQIEFDVDIRKARWYEAWASGHERHISLDASIPPSIAQTMTRWYNEQREKEQSPEETESILHENVSVNHTRTKSVPRPLTLANNNDNLNRSLPKYKVFNPRDTDATDSVSNRRAPRRLSPVIQVDESAAAEQKDVNALVRNWRASTPMAPVIPRTEKQGDTESTPIDSRYFSDIDLDDYQWSVSSAGPPSQWLASPFYDEPLRSVNLEGRMEGSVGLTSSVATSFGPDDSFPTPTFSNVSRYRSPDIAGRLMEDAPPTPTTVTSWGAPLSCPTTPTSSVRIRTPGVASRGVTSVPPTPMTATSWGAPSVGPDSPVAEARSMTPDIGLRGHGSVPVTPNTATSWGAPEVWPPSPLQEERPATPDMAERVHDDETSAKPWQLVWPFIEDEDAYDLVWPFWEAKQTEQAEPYELAWPFWEPEQAEPYDLVWPFFETEQAEQAKPYDLVWPFLEVESAPAPSAPSTVRPTTTSNNRSGLSPISEATPFFGVWPFFQADSSADTSFAVGNLSGKSPYLSKNAHVYPTSVRNREARVGPADLPNDALQNPSIGRKFSSRSYCEPHFLSPRLVDMLATIQLAKEQANPVSLYLDLKGSRKPTASAQNSTSTSESNSQCSTRYGYFDLYPAVYPNVVPYPAFYEVKPQKAPSSQESRHELPSTRLTPYPAGYHNLVIYPDVKSTVKKSKKAVSTSKLSVHPQSTRLAPAYPTFDLYPALYPYISLYPQSTGKATVGTLRTHSTDIKKETLPQSKRLNAAYPHFELYPPVYPYLTLYPPVSSGKGVKESRAIVKDQWAIKSTKLPSSYPNLDIYAPVYPFLTIYPEVRMPSRAAKAQTQAVTKSKALVPISTRLAPSYPSFTLYPTGYPDLEIYPAVKLSKPTVEPVLLSGAHWRYPNICIYPPVVKPSSVTIALPGTTSIYPDLCIYPPLTKVSSISVALPGTSFVYPHLCIYPPISISVALPGSSFDYPDIRIYPSAKRVPAPLVLSFSGASSRTSGRPLSPKERVRRG